MLIKRVSFYDFVDEFKKYNREDAFTYQGKKALFNYLNDLSEDLGEPIELDVIALCCYFTEYDCIEQFNDDYGHYIEDDIDSIDDINYYTTVIQIDDEAFIIQNF